MSGPVFAGSVFALAGRRIDVAGAEPPRFPLARVPVVRRLVAAAMTEWEARALVCSAACGADLLALEEAERLGLRRRVVLPFAPERFRRTSVTDCPGDWWAAFDRLINAAQDAGDLVVLDGQEGAAAYAAANAAIVREAQQLCRAGERLRPVAVTVWDGAAKPGDDATLAFQRLAAQAGFAALSVPTL